MNEVRPRLGHIDRAGPDDNRDGRLAKTLHQTVLGANVEQIAVDLDTHGIANSHAHREEGYRRVGATLEGRDSEDRRRRLCVNPKTGDNWRGTQEGKHEPTTI